MSVMSLRIHIIMGRGYLLFTDLSIASAPTLSLQRLDASLELCT